MPGMYGDNPNTAFPGMGMDLQMLRQLLNQGQIQQYLLSQGQIPQPQQSQDLQTLRQQLNQGQIQQYLLNQGQIPQPQPQQPMPPQNPSQTDPALNDAVQRWKYGPNEPYLVPQTPPGGANALQHMGNMSSQDWLKLLLGISAARSGG